jgi:hypothetical protein
MSGVRQALISELEADKKLDTTGINLDALAKVFGKTIDELMHGEDYPGGSRSAVNEQLAGIPVNGR